MSSERRSEAFGAVSGYRYASRRNHHNEATVAATPVPSGRTKDERGPRLEEVVRPVLRYGTLVSVVLLLLGVAIQGWLAHVGAPVSTPSMAERAWSLTGILSAAIHADPTAIMSLGLLVLIATPVLRVASTVIYFLWKRDWAYLAITSYVLLVLAIGVAVGAQG